MPGPIESLRQQIATHGPRQQTARETAPLSGMRDHQRVTLVHDVLSQITDGAEEIGMAASHRGLDQKTLATRKIRKGPPIQLASLTRIDELYDKLPDMPSREKLQQLLSRLQAMQRQYERGTGTRPGRQEILAALQDFDRDITHQYAALSLAREFFRKQTRRSSAGGAPFDSLLDEAAAEFERTDRMRDVNAGFMAAGIAHGKAPTLGTDPQAIRDSYRALLRESRHFGELFDQLCKYSLGRQFDEVCDTFIEIAGNDLSSTGPTTDPRFLGLLLAELGKLKKLRTVHESMGEMIGDICRSNPGSDDLLDTDPRTSLLLHYCCRPMTTLADARRLVSGLDKGGPLLPLLLANGLFNLHQQVPDEVMPNPGAKLRQNTVLRNLMDQLVAEEERAYQAMVEARGPSQ